VIEDLEAGAYSIKLGNEQSRHGFILLDDDLHHFSNDGSGLGIVVFPTQMRKNFDYEQFLLEFYVQASQGLLQRLRAGGLGGEGPVRIWIGGFLSTTYRDRVTFKTYSNASLGIAIAGVSRDGFLGAARVLALHFEQKTALVSYWHDVAMPAGPDLDLQGFADFEEGISEE